jgi:hypothetical protein
MASEDDMDANTVASPIFNEYNLNESVRPQSSIRVVLDDDDDESESECDTHEITDTDENISDDEEDEEDEEDDIIVTMPTTSSKTTPTTPATTRRNGKISIDITDSDDDDDDDDDDDCDIDDASTADTAEAHGDLSAPSSPLLLSNGHSADLVSPVAPSLDCHRSVAVGPMAQSPVARELSAKASDVAEARERKQLQRATVAHLAKDEALRRADEAVVLARAAQERAASTIVGAWRAFASRRRDSAVLTIQRVWRARTELVRLRNERLNAAVTLQSAWRGRRVRLEYQRQRNILALKRQHEDLERRRTALLSSSSEVLPPATPVRGGSASTTVTPVSSARKLVRSASLSHLLSTPPAPRDEETTPLVGNTLTTLSTEASQDRWARRLLQLKSEQARVSAALSGASTSSTAATATTAAPTAARPRSGLPPPRVLQHSASMSALPSSTSAVAAAVASKKSPTMADKLSSLEEKKQRLSALRKEKEELKQRLSTFGAPAAATTAAPVQQQLPLATPPATPLAISKSFATSTTSNGVTPESNARAQLRFRTPLALRQQRRKSRRVRWGDLSSTGVADGGSLELPSPVVKSSPKPHARPGKPIIDSTTFKRSTTAVSSMSLSSSMSSLAPSAFGVSSQANQNVRANSSNGAARVVKPAAAPPLLQGNAIRETPRKNRPLSRFTPLTTTTTTTTAPKR